MSTPLTECGPRAKVGVRVSVSGWARVPSEQTVPQSYAPACEQIITMLQI